MKLLLRDGAGRVLAKVEFLSDQYGTLGVKGTPSDGNIMLEVDGKTWGSLFVTGHKESPVIALGQLEEFGWIERNPITGPEYDPTHPEDKGRS
jgi:hypothetical protein